MFLGLDSPDIGWEIEVVPEVKSNLNHVTIAITDLTGKLGHYLVSGLRILFLFLVFHVKNKAGKMGYRKCEG
jgi:hypothetical protein